MATMTAAQLIELSQREDRTVTEYPSADEHEHLTTDLLCESNDSADYSGEGYSGPESRGWTEFWGDDWRVDIVNPA